LLVVRFGDVRDGEDGKEWWNSLHQLGLICYEQSNSPFRGYAKSLFVGVSLVEYCGSLEATHSDDNEAYNLIYFWRIVKYLVRYLFSDEYD
jgi:hypothetical protein